MNPFELVERTDTRGKERVQRRALSDAQAVQLLQVAGKNQLAYMLPLYAGLRRNEAKTLHWSDLVLGESGGLLRLHAAVNKNRKEQSLPLHHELAKALQKQKPANCKADDLVLVNGVPKMKEFRQDLEKAGIPFLDERGHRMDYHALRTTFITRLSTMKVHPRLAMEHGDEKTALASIYNLFPLTREIIKQHGRDCIEFTKIAIVVLNQVVRPFTEKWHKGLLKGAFNKKEKCAQFRRELAQLQAKLRQYTKMLAEMAGVEELTQIDA